MNPHAIVAVLELIELSSQVMSVPEWHEIQELTPDRPDQGGSRHGQGRGVCLRDTFAGPPRSRDGLPTVFSRDDVDRCEDFANPSYVLLSAYVSVLSVGAPISVKQNNALRS